MTKVKICGLMRLEDVSYVNGYRPDYAGFVFAESRRQVDGDWVKGLRIFLDPEIDVVGVFVNEPVENILQLCDNKTIDVIQLHGDEDEAYIQYIKNKVENPIIKALPVKTREDVLRGQELSCDYLLLDTYSSKQYGGTGEIFDLNLVPELSKPFFLAGGLTPENVKERIKAVSPYAVDVSSGVEGEDGWKDLTKIRRFIESAREE